MWSIHCFFIFRLLSFLCFVCVRERASDFFASVCVSIVKLFAIALFGVSFCFIFLCFRKLMRTRFPTHCTSRSWNYSNNNETKIPPPPFCHSLVFRILIQFQVYTRINALVTLKKWPKSRESGERKKAAPENAFQFRNQHQNQQTAIRHNGNRANAPNRNKKKREIILNSRHSQPNINNSVLFYCIFRSSSLVAGSCRASCAQAHRKEIERNLSWIFRYST